MLGGAGFVLHHGAVQRLLRPSVVSRPIGHARRGLSLRGVSRKTIDACIERMSAGPCVRSWTHSRPPSPPIPPRSRTGYENATLSLLDQSPCCIHTYVASWRLKGAG